MTDPILFAGDARRAGGSTKILELAARRGELTRIARGAYLPASDWVNLDARARHLLLIKAVERNIDIPHVFSHDSAAALWGLPKLGPWAAIPHLIVDSPRGGVAARTSYVVHQHRLPLDDIARVGDRRLTTRLRTAIDVAASARSVVAATVILDAALAADTDPKQTPDPGRFLAAIDSRRPFRGVGRVSAAMEHVSGLAGSPFESLSMVRIAELGFPRPIQQQHFFVRGEDYWTDFFWPEFDVIGEADGWAKYANDPTGEALKREKRREDALREQVTGFARWEWADAWAGGPLAERLLRAGVRRERGHAARTRG